MLTRASLLSLLLISAASIQAEAQSRVSGSQSFYDARFGMEFEFPTEWKLTSRSDIPGVEDYLTLVSGYECAHGPCTISIGKRPQKVDAKASLYIWALDFAETVSDDLNVVSERLPVDAKSRGFQERVSISGPNYHSENLRKENDVWFVSANFSDWSEHRDTFQLVLQTLRISRQSSLATGERSPDMTPIYLDDDFGSLESLSKLSSSWYSPVRNQSNGTPWSVNCGSPAHYGGSTYAADVAASYGVPVRAAKEGEVFRSDKVGNATPFGKYVVIKTGNYYHYYAHLSSVRSYVNVGYNVSRRGLLLGYVGDTGAGGTHLHFHIQDDESHTRSNSILLNGMTGFTDFNYPGGGYNCATMGR